MVSLQFSGKKDLTSSKPSLGVGLCLSEAPALFRLSIPLAEIPVRTVESISCFLCDLVGRNDCAHTRRDPRKPSRKNQIAVRANASASASLSIRCFVLRDRESRHPLPARAPDRIPVVSKPERPIVRVIGQRLLDCHSDRIRFRRGRRLSRQPFAEHFLAQCIADGFSQRTEFAYLPLGEPAFIDSHGFFLPVPARAPDCGANHTHLARCG